RVERLVAGHAQMAVAVPLHRWSRETRIASLIVELRAGLREESRSTAIDCRTSSGSGARGAENPESCVREAKSLLAVWSGPNSTRQRGAACTKTGSRKAASIIAHVQRPVVASHAKRPSASATSAMSAQRPELMIARGSALRIQPPILTADTNKESASVAYATTVKSMVRCPLRPSIHPRCRFGRVLRTRIDLKSVGALWDSSALAYSLTAPVIAET